MEIRLPLFYWVNIIMKLLKFERKIFDKNITLSMCLRKRLCDKLWVYSRRLLKSLNQYNYQVQIPFMYNLFIHVWCCVSYVNLAISAISWKAPRAMFITVYILHSNIIQICNEPITILGVATLFRPARAKRILINHYS
jgi:hypothetical protein